MVYFFLHQLLKQDFCKSIFKLHQTFGIQTVNLFVIFITVLLQLNPNSNFVFPKKEIHISSFSFQTFLFFGKKKETVNNLPLKNPHNIVVWLPQVNLLFICGTLFSEITTTDFLQFSQHSTVLPSLSFLSSFFSFFFCFAFVYAAY